MTLLDEMNRNRGVFSGGTGQVHRGLTHTYLISSSSPSDDFRAASLHGGHRIFRMLWVHRNNKLENILLDADDNVVVGDFGLAYDFSSGSMVHGPFGAPGYRSPEVSHGELYSAKTDVYSLMIANRAVHALRIGDSLKACLSCMALMQFY